MRFPHPARAFFVAFAAGAVVSACLNPVTRGVEPDAGCSCTSAADCAPGEGCLECQCGSCTRSSQCLPGRVCVDGTCRGCQGTFECSPPSECISALCTGNCLSDQDCADGGLVCNLDAGVCVSCTRTAQCGDQICSSGRCVACTTNSQCLNSACVNGHCGGCLTGADCPAGLACANGVCGACAAANAVCPPDRVCQLDGGCEPCVNGAACSTNPNACVVGSAECGVGTVTCSDTAVPRAPGASCAVGVCDGDAGCVACSEGAGCSTNPNVCKRGVIGCSMGGPVCSDSTVDVDAGARCGTSHVCSGTGTCNACDAGVSCSSNPTVCRAGVTSCGTGAETCVDTPDASVSGTPCDGGACNGAGVCAPCVPGVMCTGNPNVCRRGAVSCTTGAPLCLNTDAGVTNGTGCGGANVCNNGTCCAPNWVDVSGCDCSPSCEATCNGSKTQSDGCGRTRQVGCSETGGCCPCANGCRWQGGNCDGFCPVPQRHYEEYCPIPCSCNNYAFSGAHSCQNTSPCP